MLTKSQLLKSHRFKNYLSCQNYIGVRHIHRLNKNQHIYRFQIIDRYHRFQKIDMNHMYQNIHRFHKNPQVPQVPDGQSFFVLHSLDRTNNWRDKTTHIQNVCTTYDQKKNFVKQLTQKCLSKTCQTKVQLVIFPPHLLHNHLLQQKCLTKFTVTNIIGQIFSTDNRLPASCSLNTILKGSRWRLHCFPN